MSCRCYSAGSLRRVIFVAGRSHRHRSDLDQAWPSRRLAVTYGYQHNNAPGAASADQPPVARVSLSWAAAASASRLIAVSACCVFDHSHQRRLIYVCRTPPAVNHRNDRAVQPRLSVLTLVDPSERSLQPRTAGHSHCQESSTYAAIAGWARRRCH